MLNHLVMQEHIITASSENGICKPFPGQGYCGTFTPRDLGYADASQQIVERILKLAS